MAVKKTTSETKVQTEIKVIGRENFLKMLQEVKASLTDSMEKIESLESLFLNEDERQGDVILESISDNESEYNE